MSAASTAEGRVIATRTLILGIGNPILGDDGVGWAVARQVAARLNLEGDGPGSWPATAPGVEVDGLAVGGLALMERLVGFGHAILVDAIHGSGDPPGTVRRRAVGEIPGREASHLDSAHDVPLSVALETGRRLGAALPVTIVVVSVEAEWVDRFGEDLSPAVAAAVPRAVATVLEALGEACVPGEARG